MPQSDRLCRRSLLFRTALALYGMKVAYNRINRQVENKTFGYIRYCLSSTVSADPLVSLDVSGQ